MAVKKWKLQGEVKMSSGVRKSYRGSFVGTGALQSILVVGFRPKSVRLLNVTTLVKGEWSESMADGSMVKEVTAGDMTFIATQGITPLANGFSVGTDSVNTAAATVHFIAEE
jgi:hypothetical protein